MKSLINVFLFVIILLISFLPLTSQNVDVLGSSNEVINDTLRVQQYLKESKNIAWKDIGHAEEYARQALSLSEKIDYKIGIAKAKFLLSSIFTEYEFEISEQLALEVFEHARELNDSTLMPRFIMV